MMDVRDLLRQPLQRRAATPLHRQIYDRVRQAVLLGQLEPGQRVASARALASQLGLARGTVDAAYAQLAVEGYLEPMGQKGTRVPPNVLGVVPARPVRAARPAIATAPDGLAPNPPLPFQMGMPALDAFPRKLWARIGVRRFRSAGAAELAYPDPQGAARLRKAVAAYLLLSRGVRCEAEQVFITAGYRASLDLVCRVLLRPGDRFCIEDPCYPTALERVQAAGARVAHVPVDEHGLRVDWLLRRHADAKLVLVTPAHQAPLGVSLTLARRMALLSWAQERGGWIVEDDYDSEFRYTGAPLPAMKSADTVGRVLYAGTFSKVLFPGLSLAYLIVPWPQVAAFREQACMTGNGCPPLPQEIVADFMDLGHFSRHIKKMRSLYALRRRHLVEALAATFGHALRIELQAGGMHLLARLPDKASDQLLASRAQAAGLAVQALSERARGRHAGQGLLLGFTNVGSPDEALALARKLKKALGAFP